MVFMVKIGWTRKLFGDRGERAACRFLKRKGFKILKRQVRTGLGEIDIIAQDRQTIVFVEVKTRRSHRAGHPSEAVTRTKQKQLTRAALAWLKRNGMLERPARFDVIAIIWTQDGKPRIEHFEHAFEAIGGGMYG